MHYPHKGTKNGFLHSVVPQISILPNEGFLLWVVVPPPPPLKLPFCLHTFLQQLGPFKDLFCSKSAIVLNEVGMDILGTIYKSCALKYQVEGNRLNKKKSILFA